MDRKPLDIDSCASKKELKAYAANQLFGTRNEEIYMHLKRCAKCLRQIAKLKQPVPSAEDIIEGGRGGLLRRIMRRLRGQ